MCDFLIGVAIIGVVMCVVFYIAKAILIVEEGIHKLDRKMEHTAKNRRIKQKKGSKTMFSKGKFVKALQDDDSDIKVRQKVMTDFTYELARALGVSLDNKLRFVAFFEKYKLQAGDFCHHELKEDWVLQIACYPLTDEDKENWVLGSGGTTETVYPKPEIRDRVLEDIKKAVANGEFAVRNGFV